MASILDLCLEHRTTKPRVIKTIRQDENDANKPSIASKSFLIIVHSTMKKLFASLMIVFYTLASNTLAHSFAMNKITTHDSDHQTVHCPYHAQESSHADHNPNSTSSD